MKIADTEKEKAQKRMQSLASNMFGLGLSLQLGQGSLGGLGMTSNTYQQVYSLEVCYFGILDS